MNTSELHVTIANIFSVRDLQSPSRFRNKDSRKPQVFSIDLGTVLDGDFVKTRLHFMKVSVDLFRILRFVTYFKVPFPREK
jgi:hypothetical protein